MGMGMGMGMCMGMGMGMFCFVLLKTLWPGSYWSPPPGISISAGGCPPDFTSASLFYRTPLGPTSLFAVWASAFYSAWVSGSALCHLWLSPL